MTPEASGSNPVNGNFFTTHINYELYLQHKIIKKAANDLLLKNV